jgi:hypothetical protein
LEEYTGILFYILLRKKSLDHFPTSFEIKKTPTISGRGYSAGVAGTGVAGTGAGAIASFFSLYFSRPLALSVSLFFS